MKKSSGTKFHRIRIKLFAAILAVMILFMALVTVFSSPLLFRVFASRTYRQLSSVGERINSCFPGSVTYYFDLYSIAINNNVSFEMTDADGILTYVSDNGSSPESSSHFPSSTRSTGDYPSMVNAKSKYSFRKYDNFEIKSKPATNAAYFVYSSVLDTGELLHIYYPVADIESIVSSAVNVYLGMTFALVLAVSVIIFIIVTRFTDPLVEMNDITKDMAALNFERKCGDYGKDEIGELGRSINTLSTALDATLIDLKDKNDQLEKDIERRHALDNARKSFISNVSHELKTPIAIISGYAEGLCEGISDDPDVIREYCQIINDESQKMNSLVVELLELSKLESKSQPFNPVEFDLGQKIASVLSHLSLQFEQNGITVVNNVPSPLMCYAQEEKIEIAIRNYVTNAVSHCSGEKRIELNCADRGECVEISVFNTGENIADADLPELWDSFYRADKAHGRSENRFGLGLSIVKSIMVNHNCKYGVKNVENGVVFTLEVPKDSSYYAEK